MSGNVRQDSMVGGLELGEGWEGVLSQLVGWNVKPPEWEME